MTSHQLTIIAVSILGLLTLAGSRTQPAKDSEGNKVLLPHPQFKYIGILATVFGLILGFVYPFENQIEGFLGMEMEDTYMAAILAVVFLMVGLSLFLFAIKNRVTFSDTYIRTVNFWRKPIEISWSQVNKIKFGSVSRYLILYTANKQVWVYAGTIGFVSFLDKMQEKVSPELYEKALKVIHKKW